MGRPELKPANHTNKRKRDLTEANKGNKGKGTRTQKGVGRNAKFQKLNAERKIVERDA